MSIKLLFLALIANTHASFLESPDKATSDDACEPCKPQDATGTNPPAIGPELSSLYINILQSVKGIEFQKRQPIEARDTAFCCRATLNCVNVQSLNIPMCYDKFTTNFLFADGSYGSLTTGEYSSNGNGVNLINGDYTANGQQGNIYASNPADKPNTSTLSIPPQYTGSGVGSAIPANQLGSVLMYTTTVAGTTVTQATTIAAQTSVVTTRNAAASVAASSTGAAGQVIVDAKGSMGMSYLGALAYALYAF